MPLFDLRQNDGTLNPLAPFKVLAVMCHPNARIRREKMLGTIQQEIGERRPRRRPLTSGEFFSEVQRIDTRAAVAGGLLLTMLQLQASNYEPSLNRAIPLVSALLPKWEQPLGPDWSKDCHVGHHPCSRENKLQAYNEFRNVSHLWAALIHGEQHGRQDVWPGSVTTLPTFIEHAEAILELACCIPSFVAGQRFAITRSEAWRFTIPNLERITLRVLPLSAEQLQFSTSGDSVRL
jgi:hypothetical protein